MSHRHTRSDSTVRDAARTTPPLSAGGPSATAALRGPGAALTVVLAVLLAMVLAPAVLPLYPVHRLLLQNILFRLKFELPKRLLHNILNLVA